MEKKSTKPVVLIIHGYTGYDQSFLPLASRLIGYGIPAELALLPGHGTDSAENYGKYTYQDWINYLQTKINDLSKKHEQIILFGHSLGGVLALNLAHTNPGLIHHVYTFNLALWRVPFWLRIVKYFLPIIQRFKPWYIFDSNNRAPLSGLVTVINLVIKTYPLIEKLEIPVTLFYGDKDEAITPEYSYKTAEKIVNSELVLLENARHLPGIEESHIWDQIVGKIVHNIKNSQNLSGTGS